MIALYLPEIRLGLDEPEARLRQRAAELLGIPSASVETLDIRRLSLDTRQRSAIWRVYGVEVGLPDGAVPKAVIERFSQFPKRAKPAPSPVIPTAHVTKPVVIVGAGPAGLFCAQRLADAGVRSIIVERGKDIRSRAQDTKRFMKGGSLDPDSNIQFGEGGAGTYSDGKLTYRTDDPLAAWVLDVFVRHGAKPEIRYQNRPHIGTEHLRAAIVRMGQTLRASGVEYRYGARVTGVLNHRKRAAGVRLAGGQEIESEHVVLAVGHSARETFRSLHEAGVAFEPKAFAVGVRIEHPQPMINEARYGAHAKNPSLPAASYSLSRKVEAGGERGAYSFCMCPGGEIMACSSDLNGVVTNGMSYSVQRSGYANAGLVVSMTPEDAGASPSDPLAGIRFQEALETAAFELGGGDYRAPAQRVSDFLRGGTSGNLASDATTYRLGVSEADLTEILPAFVVQGLRQALPHFTKKIPGYSGSEGIMVGLETRTSSPIRIPRTEDTLESVSLPGLYPAGEGAGYAGGIVSAAVDGARIADVILRKYGR